MFDPRALAVVFLQDRAADFRIQRGELFYLFLNHIRCPPEVKLIKAESPVHNPNYYTTKKNI